MYGVVDRTAGYIKERRREPLHGNRQAGSHQTGNEKNGEGPMSIKETRRGKEKRREIGPKVLAIATRELSLKARKGGFKRRNTEC